MKNFATTFVAAFIAMLFALFVYHYLVVQPREDEQAAAVQMNVSKAKEQAQEIANNFDQAVKKTIGDANDTMNSQTGEMQKRALAADAIARASMFKTALAEYFMTNGHWPKNHNDSGLAAPESYAGGAVSSISVGGKGTVIVTLNDKIESGAKIKLIPDANEQSYVINWRCITEGSEALKLDLPACNQ